MIQPALPRHPPAKTFGPQLLLNMKSKLWLLPVLCGLTLAAGAAIPPAEKLLPADTLGMMTVPDWDKAKAAYQDFPMAQLWRDPAMKPFADKFLNKFKEEVLGPLERELGVKLENYADLLHGQVTLAVTQNGWEGQGGQLPGFVLLLDSKNKGDLLKKNLAELKKKWVDSGKQIKTDKIRDVEFTTLIISGADLAKTFEKVFPDAKGEKAPDDATAKATGEKIQIMVGQSESLLLVGNSPKDFEKILSRQAGGTATALAELPVYEANHNALFRDALVFGWIHFKPIATLIAKKLTEASAGGGSPSPIGVKPDKIMEVLGLTGVKTLAFNMNQSSEGLYLNLYLGAPEPRRGLTKLLQTDAKEASPPPFITAEVTKFSRWRMDGQKIWATLEAMIKEISPQLSSVVSMTVDAAGKDKDPNFDVRKSLIGNLGNDFISFEKPPRGANLADLNSAPALTLIGSPRADQLAAALKAVASLMPGETVDIKEREFLGRKVYSIKLPPTPSPDGLKLVEKTLSFGSSGGYVGLSTEVALLEEFLRSSETSGKKLAEMAGLSDAAQKVGGMNTGWFGYENQAETRRVLLETLKQDPTALEKIFANPFPGAAGGGIGKGLKDWFDVGLIPSFDKLAKYFHFSVYSVTANPDGFYFKTFSPTPPSLRK